MKKLIALLILISGTALADCVCKFGDTEYEIKKGMFGLVYGTPIKKPTPTPTATASATGTPIPSVTPTATTTPKPTGTPSASPTITPSPTPTSTPVTSKLPRGLFYLLAKDFNDTAGFKNQNGIDGVRLRMGWNEIQKVVDGPYDWTKIDRAVSNAKKNGKKIGIAVASLAADTNPTGLEAAGCKMVVLSNGTIPWINDPVFKTKWGKFITELGVRFDGKVDYVAMGGLGSHNFESHFADTTEDETELDKFGGLAGWKTAVIEIAKKYSDSFPNTVFEFTAGNPYKSAKGSTAMREALDVIVPSYGGRCGVMNSTLNAESSITFPPNEYVNKYAATNPCGFQFLTNCSGGFNEHDCRGTLKQVLDKGVELLKGHGFLEVYAKDADDSANAALLKEISAKLK